MAENDLKQKTGTKTRSARINRAVQGTNDSSLKSKWSAASHGYFSDDFLTCFGLAGFSNNGRDSCVRTPVINRGYWIRMNAVNHVIQSFFNFYGRSTSTQVISLGAGYDTTYFRLASAGHMQSTCYIEVDFPELLTKKLEMIQKTEKLSKFFSTLDKPANVVASVVFDSPGYKLIGVDLTDLRLLMESLKLAGVDLDRPTLLLSEVVLVYLNPESSTKLIEWAANSFQNAIFVTYEQVYPFDAFGIFMCQHFTNIGTRLKSIREFPSIASQVSRYCSMGWTETVACDMNFYYNNVVPTEERLRVDGLQMFDEFEEWHLKCAHYVLVTAFKGSCTQLRNKIWSNSVPEVIDDAVPSGVVERESEGQMVYSLVGALDWVSMETRVKMATVEAVLGNPQVGQWCQLYGHTCNRLLVSGKDALLLVGGFGMLNAGKPHRRVNCCRLVFGSNWIQQVEVSLFESMYHSTTNVSAEEVVIFGGRTSPGKPSADVFRLGFKKTDDSSDQITKNLERVSTSGDGPCARWRHSAALTKVSGIPTIVVFGGRSNDQKCLNDCWTLNCETWQWQEVLGTGDVPSARHTHTSEVWKSDVLVICGLGPNQTPLASIHSLNTANQKWRTLQLFGEPLLPRYSHTSAVHKDRLILVGGVSLALRLPAVTVIELASGTTMNFDIKIPCPSDGLPIMLHNHSSILISDDEDEARVMVVGGGGNCFSFGTHLNDHTLILTFI